MSFLGSLFSAAAPIAGAALGGTTGMAGGSLLAGLLGGSGNNQFTQPNVYGQYNQYAPQIQGLISQLQQGGLSTRPYDAMRKNIESDAFRSAEQMNKNMNQQLTARGMGNSTYRNDVDQSIYAKALSDMAGRMAALDTQQQAAMNADQFNRSSTALQGLLSLLGAGSGLDRANAGLNMNTQKLNYLAGQDRANSLGALGALFGKEGGADWLQGLFGGGSGMIP